MDIPFKRHPRFDAMTDSYLGSEFFQWLVTLLGRRESWRWKMLGRTEGATSATP